MSVYPPGLIPCGSDALGEQCEKSLTEFAPEHNVERNAERKGMHTNAHLDIKLDIIPEAETTRPLNPATPGTPGDLADIKFTRME